MGEDESQSIWKSDGAEAYVLFKIKFAITDALDVWDLPLAYRKCRLLRMELDAMFKREHKKKVIKDYEHEAEEIEEEKKKKSTLTEKQEVDNLMKDLDEAYSKYNPENSNDEQKSLMFQKIEAFYMHLCYLMKKHGMFYREGEDMTLAVLRR